MIPVALQAAPAEFERLVRTPGLAWLEQNGIALNQPPPKAGDLPDLWTKVSKDLWKAYSGVCAYLAIYFEWVIGGHSTDHFVAKSRNAVEAYNWDNYRLACLGANRKKHAFDDVLDPIGLRKDTFLLNLTSGKMSANKAMSTSEIIMANKTISRLQLNSPEHIEMRRKRWCRYISGKDKATLEELSPFIFYEAQRQGQL